MSDRYYVQIRKNHRTNYTYSICKLDYRVGEDCVTHLNGKYKGMWTSLSEVTIIGKVIWLDTIHK